VSNTNFAISVSVDFSGVTFENGQWFNQPSWSITPTDQLVPPVYPGNTNTITWTLSASNVPSGFTAAFSDPAINFTGDVMWTGGAPSNQTSNTCVVGDNFDGLPTEDTYEYEVVVNLSNGAVTEPFLYDPDVENESGSAPPPAVRLKRQA
jgi:hypothetical protein